MNNFIRLIGIGCLVSLFLLIKNDGCNGIKYALLFCSLNYTMIEIGKELARLDK